MLWLCCDCVVIVLGVMWTCDLPWMCFSTMYITEQRNRQSTTAVRSSRTWGVVTSIRFRVMFTQCSRGCCKLFFALIIPGNGQLIKSLRSLIILVWEKEIERFREDVSIAVSLWCVKCSFECCDQWRCRIVLYLPRTNEWRMNRNYQQLAAGPEQTVVSSLCGVRSIVPLREYMMTHELQSKVKINKRRWLVSYLVHQQTHWFCCNSWTCDWYIVKTTDHRVLYLAYISSCSLKYLPESLSYGNSSPWKSSYLR